VAGNVVFIHGFQDCNFDPQEKGQKIKERLENCGWKVFSLTYSEGKPTKQSLRDSTDKLAEEIRKQGLTKVDAIIGHSMGGLVACDLARAYRALGIKKVIMLETPVSGMPAWLLRIWAFIWQRNASYDWPSIQAMKKGNEYFEILFRGWPTHEIAVFQIEGSLGKFLGRFSKTPAWIRTYKFPKVRHDGPDGLRGNPEVLDCIAKILAT
jgi:pimeloyl-ACP methyl ester carboxylesterase